MTQQAPIRHAVASAVNGTLDVAVKALVFVPFLLAWGSIAALGPKKLDKKITKAVDDFENYSGWF